MMSAATPVLSMTMKVDRMSSGGLTDHFSEPGFLDQHLIQAFIFGGRV